MTQAFPQLSAPGIPSDPAKLTVNFNPGTGTIDQARPRDAFSNISDRYVFSPEAIKPPAPSRVVTGTQLLAGELDRKTGKTLLDKVLSPAAKFVLTLASPLIDYTKDLADIYSENKISKQVAEGKLPSSALGATGAFDKTTSQYLGDAIGSGLLISGLSPYGKLSDLAVREAVSSEANASLVNKVFTAFGKNFVSNLPFAASMELSAGGEPLKKPKEFAQATLINTAVMAALNTTLEGGLPTIKAGVDRFKTFQGNFETELISKGYSPAQAEKLAAQGGFIGRLPEPETLTPEFLKAKREIADVPTTEELLTALPADTKEIKKTQKLLKQAVDNGYTTVQYLESRIERLRNLPTEATPTESAGIRNEGISDEASALANEGRIERSLAPEGVESRLALQNLAREATGQEPLPKLIEKPLSYEESILQPLLNRQDAKTALIMDRAATDSAIGAPKEPKVYGELVADAEQFKDISGFKGQARDVYRNFKAFFGDKFELAKEQILDPFDAAKGRNIDEQKALLDEFKSEVVDKYGIKAGSRESAAVMDLGEGLKTEAEIAKEFGEQKARQIVEADRWFRNKYDNLLAKVNEVRAEIYPNRPEKLIPRRQDYYRHFRDLSGLEGLKNIFETPAGISPELSGISPYTKPKSKFLSFAQRRLGIKSERDAVGGYLNYVPSYAYAHNIDPEIGKFRRLAADLAIQTENSRNANNFIEYLQDFSNDLAGKSNSADRFIQKVIPGGRKTFAAIDWLNKRVKSNTILGNAASSVAQIFNVPQGIASAKGYSVPGAVRTMGGIFHENGPMLKSDFIKERYSSTMFDKFDTEWLAKPKQFAAWMTGVLDEAGTKFIWNSHYEKARAKGFKDPVKYADDTTRALVAGRGVGEVPLIQKSKVFQLAAPFTLEVGNLWYVMSDFVKAKDFAGLATLFVSNWLFNQVAKKVRGSDVTFDPINAVYEGISELQADDDKAKGSAKLLGRVAGEVLSNVPLGQTLASLYPENGFSAVGDITRSELFGEGDPTRFGGGLVATKGIQDPLFKVILPFGGGQAEKAWQGLKAYNQGEVQTKAGKTKFKVEQSPANLIKSLLFGPSSTSSAQEYYGSQSAPKESKSKPGELPSLPKLPKLPKSKK